MGNRAVISTPKKDFEVYLQWNGGRDSIEPFLAYCKSTGVPSPESSPQGWVKLCQTIGNFFGTPISLSLGLEPAASDIAFVDNGGYVISDWEIIDRRYPYEGFVEQATYDFNDFLSDVAENQPRHSQWRSPATESCINLAAEGHALAIQLSSPDNVDQLVASLLSYADIQGVRSPANDASYGFARLCHLLGNVMDAHPEISASVVAASPTLENTYLIDGSWHVTNHQLPMPDRSGLEFIDSCQPADISLGHEFLACDIVPSDSIHVGDKVICRVGLSDYETHTVVDISGNGEPIVDAYDHPYTDPFSGEKISDYSWNPNNYIRDDSVRLVSKSPTVQHEIEALTSASSPSHIIGEYLHAADSKTQDRG